LITIIDYGMGNLGSVEKAFVYLGEEVLITNNKHTINEATTIVLPGVGAFKDAMANLEKLDLIEVIKEGTKSKPFLGICLGMQMLFDSSEEGSEKVKGLGVLGGEIKKFSDSINLKIPHIGWNNVKFQKKSDITNDINDMSRFYFVHSYYLDAHDPNIVLGKTTYGLEFDSIVQKDNIIATQFHPEKSGDIGIKLLKNFVNFSNNFNGGKK
jgi:glutamine amidotransferase